MASEEIKKKWGTIFMGDREASVEQINAMQEPLHREQRQKEQAADYLERVRARAADRAREILGAAYAERQKIIEEARNEAIEQKKAILAECAKIRSEAATARKLAQNELEQAKEERIQAENMRNAGHEEGYQAGLEQATAELHEFRTDLAQSLGSLMRAIQWQHKDILANWREDLVTLVQCAAQAGTGYVLNSEHEKILRAMVFMALDQLESRKTISLRVNTEDEAQVSDLFRAARERYPELGQWIVAGDDKIEKGGLIVESGTGRVDLQRENFRALVDGVLAHLALPEGDNEENYEAIVREIVEKEAGHIASLTPEQDKIAESGLQPDQADDAFQVAKEAVAEADEPVEPELPLDESVEPEDTEAEEAIFTEEDLLPDASELDEAASEITAAPEEAISEDLSQASEAIPSDPSLAALEEELFPLEGEEEIPQTPQNGADAGNVEHVEAAPARQQPEEESELQLDQETLSTGGFL